MDYSQIAHDNLTSTATMRSLHQAEREGMPPDEFDQISL